MRVRVFYHDRCFDGASSAAVFSRFYRERIREDVQFEFSGLLHRAGALFDESKFTGDENAIVDFKYSPSPKITWWFDHHQSAFLSESDAEHFEQDQSNRKFYDPDFKSCTKFIATITEERFGFNPEPLADLIHWTDVIDGALYEDAKTAVEMKAPAMKLTMVIESAHDHDFVPRLIPLLATEPLGKIIETPFVAERLPELLSRHRDSVEVMRKRIECKDGTVFFDVTDLELEGYNKFIPYYLFPECVYSVGLSKSNFRTKVAVGSNPWNNIPDMENLAKICERYGGGGHARVGAISFDVNQLEGARKAAGEIVAELRDSYRRHQKRRTTA
ncbi:MAG TPA: phosphoesterase [Terriglobales bacterium]|nr:phosphoesterase [Terriglobales bacterium]